MCANDWDRLPNDMLRKQETELNEFDEEFRLRSRYAGRNYWDERERTKPPMAPAA